MIIWKIAKRYPTRNQAYLMAIRVKKEGIPYQVKRDAGEYGVFVPESYVKKAKQIVSDIETEHTNRKKVLDTKGG